ncbi:Uncharacterised protein [Candidatus Anstonella stagnisolia]|nr:Uncharacterised protein [Candidatus Anstonella stagnisolia]
MNELTFLDLAVLLKIDTESTVEKFGSSINTSFFETANLLGTMKLKGYLDIMSSVGGLSRVVLTDAGASILTVANEKSREPIDALDTSILSTLASGVRDLEGISNAINIRQGDLAYHLQKLSVQQYIDYTLRSAKIYVSLTEKGFNSTGGIRAQTTAPATGTSTPQAQPTTQPATTALSKPVTPQTTLVAQPKPASGSPPWVPKNLVSVSEAAAASEDVDALMKQPQEKKEGASAQGDAKAAQSGQHNAQPPHHPAHHKPKDVKFERFISKISFYLSAYLPYLVLLLLFCALLFYALTSAFIKLG